MKENWRHSKLYIAITGFFKGFSTLLVYELIEEALENAIAWGISFAIAKALSFLLVVVLTQTTKIGIKALIRVLKPVIKKFIYKEGFDKMKNLKANWKNYLGVISAIATAVIPFVQKLMDFGIGIKLFGFNIVPFVLIILTSIVAIIGVVVDGVHGQAVWQKIVAVKKEVAETKNEIKEEINAQKNNKDDIDDIVNDILGK